MKENYITLREKQATQVQKHKNEKSKDVRNSYQSQFEHFESRGRHQGGTQLQRKYLPAVQHTCYK